MIPYIFSYHGQNSVKSLWLLGKPLEIEDISNDLLDLTLVPSVEHDELEHYLFTKVEDVKDGLIW